jgi:hypothetical protein
MAFSDRLRRGDAGLAEGGRAAYHGPVHRMRWPLLCAVTLLWMGCPRDVEVPDVPSGAERCEAHPDCNEATCGRLRACVDGLCEPPDAGSLAVACD